MRYSVIDTRTGAVDSSWKSAWDATQRAYNLHANSWVRPGTFVVRSI